jgi:two-component system LytT family response regulator
MLTALVIDDELLAREELTELLHETGSIQVVGEAGNAIEGLKKINTIKPDVVFLDIQMPQLSGMDLLTMLDPDTMPMIVFVTAFDQYAIQAFEDNAFDYLLKPVEPERLNKTVCRLLRQHKKESQPRDMSVLTADQLEQIPCTGHNRIMLVPAEEVECAFSDISGVHISTGEQTSTTQLTLKTLEEKTALLRCHRQYLVNLKTIKEIKLLENGLAEIITQHNHTIPVSRRHLKELKETLGIG